MNMKENFLMSMKMAVALKCHFHVIQSDSSSIMCEQCMTNKAKKKINYIIRM